MRVAPTIIASAVVALFGLGEAKAEGPWCAVAQIGGGGTSMDCSFRTLEECLPNVIGGNRGTCNQNPRWHGRIDVSTARHRPGRRDQVLLPTRRAPQDEEVVSLRGRRHGTRQTDTEKETQKETQNDKPMQRPALGPVPDESGL